MTNEKAEPNWLKPTLDYTPLAVFFIVYMLSPDISKSTPLLTATAALMVTTAVALVVSLIVVKRIPMMPLITAVIVGVFGGLTLWLQDETFIKMKPTIVQALFAIILFTGLLFKKPLLRPLMSAAWPMDDAGWHKLTLRFAWFFVSMALLNEIIWRTQSTDFWISFKVFGLIILTLVFAASQAGLMQRHALPKE
ncbi:MAG: hypothetical protein CMM37_12260 [Rhodospirillaceae bacterium]|nr:hypothetical protein [Rhodospirillaceae bacterium]